MRKNKKLILISSILATGTILAVPTVSIINNINTVNGNNSQLDNVVQNNEAQVEINSIDSDIDTIEFNDQLKAVGETFTVDAAILMAVGWATNITGSLVFTVLDDSAKTVSVKADNVLNFVATNFNIQSTITNASTTYHITEIPNFSFQHCSGLTGTLNIPASVTSIGNEAFQHCSGLTDVLTIPASVTNIGSGAFGYCSRLTGALIIPTSVIFIGDQTFRDCYGLTGLDLSNATSLLTIGDNAFNNCSGLTGNLIISASVTSIGEDAFAFCPSLTGSLIIPTSVTFIGDSAFNGIGSKDIKFLSQTPPAILRNNIFGTNNFTITINVPKDAKIAWDATSDILKNLGIVNYDQIKEFATPVRIEEITFKKAGPYVYNNTLTNKTDVVMTSSKILPANVDQTINWSITTKDQIIKPNNISIDTNGQVTIDPTNGMLPTKYDLTIKATSAIEQNISTTKDIIICIGAMDPVTFQTPGPIDVENNITIETPKNKAISTINPLDVNLSIKWTIQNLDGTVAPSWITIKPDGQICVNNTNAATIEKYEFKVIATCNKNETINASSEIVVNVFDPTIPTDIEEITLDKEGPYIFNNTIANQTDVVKASSKILPADADQTIKWSITTKGQVIDKPDNISIDPNGQVTIDPTNGMQPIKYDLTIKATCPTDDTITTSKDIIICIGTMDHVTFQTSGPIDVENNITTETPKNKAISAINPLDANLSIKWTIKNLDGTVTPSWITIKPDGQICVNNTNAATIEKYEFKVIATCNENETISASSNIIVNVVEPINDLNLPLIIGVSVGVVVGAAAIAGGITYGVKRNKTKK